MNILLVNPSINIREALGSAGRFMEPMPTIGLAYIAAVLEKNGIHVEIIDDFVSRIGINGIVEQVKKRKPDLVGISCITPNAFDAFQISRKIKENSIGTKVVMGNIHASLFAESILENGDADIIVHGEGEYTMLELAKTLENDGDLGSVKGISFVDDGEVVHNPRRDFIQDLDKLPFPAWHLFPEREYGLIFIALLKRPALPILGSRGCPFNCSFCCLEILGHQRRKRSAKNIVDEIEYLVDMFGVKQVAFADSMFPMKKSEGMEFHDEMISRGMHERVVWVTFARVDTVDKELLEKMKEAGCRRVMYGIESGAQSCLDEVRKGLTIKDVEETISLTKDVGLETVGSFMLALPGETHETLQQTIELAKKLDLDFAKFALMVPYPGSELYEILSSQGKLRTEDWSKFTPFNPDPETVVYVPDGVSAEELLSAQKKAMREFYMRPKIILRHLFKIKTIGMADLLRGFFTIVHPMQASLKRAESRKLS